MADREFLKNEILDNEILDDEQLEYVVGGAPVPMIFNLDKINAEFQIKPNLPEKNISKI